MVYVPIPNVPDLGRKTVHSCHRGQYGPQGDQVRVRGESPELRAERGDYSGEHGWGKIACAVLQPV